MKIAVLIIALFLAVGVGLQSCTIVAGSGMIGNEALGKEASIGLATSFLFVLGGAFVLGLPMVSWVIFGLAGFVAYNSGKEFSDLKVWGVVAFVLCIMSGLASHNDRKKKKAAAAALNTTNVGK